MCDEVESVLVYQLHSDSKDKQERIAERKGVCDEVESVLVYQLHSDSKDT